MKATTDAQTGLRTRTITHDGWQITQVEQSDGTWWNITIQRVRS